MYATLAYPVAVFDYLYIYNQYYTYEYAAHSLCMQGILRKLEKAQALTHALEDTAAAAAAAASVAASVAASAGVVLLLL